MKEVIERMANKIKSSVGKALIESISDGNEIQLVKVSGLDNETQSDLERVQDYGLTSNPPIGSEAVVLYVGGSKDHGIVIKTDSGEFRVQSLESGEVCIYSKFGQKILLDKNGEIVFNDGTDFATGFTDLKTGFDLLRTELNAFVTVYGAHVHTGVLAGTVSSGAPAAPAVAAVATIDAAKIEGIKLP